MTKFDPYDTHQFDELEPLAAILATWTAQVDNPLLGNFAAVRSGFPALAQALDRFANDYELSDSAPSPEIGTVSPETRKLIEQATSLHVQEAPSVPYEDEDDFTTDAARYIIGDKPLEEIAERARVATERLRSWGRKRAYRGASAEEAALRLRLIVYLNNRDEMTQRKIAELIGVSVARVTQLVGEYYNRLDYEQHIVKRRKAKQQ